MSDVVRLALALGLLNSALTFQNRWPTAGVRWVPELSVELSALVFVLALIVAWRGAPGRALRGIILGGYLLLVLGRYVDVTVPALMGRSIHLYWDSQHLPGVTAMFLDRVAGWQLALGGLALLALLSVVVVALRWALATVMTTLGRPGERRTLGALAAMLLVCYGAGRLDSQLPLAHRFALPVTAMLVEQGRLVLEATLWRRHDRLAGQPLLPTSDLSRLRRGDLFVIFFESYGALTFDDPRFSAPLAAEREALEQSLSAVGWRVASARVTSSTFGGGSWLAHSSLLAGLRIADQGDYQSLLTTDRPTLVSRFAAAGYRTVAIMPGLRYPWPEGQFYGFDLIYQADRLDYRGPAYGWWVIPDQYSLYRVHQREVALNERTPLLVFFPTIDSHAPFAPLPPYRPDWRDFDARSEAVVPSEDMALSERLDGQELAAAYIRSIRYNFAVLGGYLRQLAPANALVLTLGDHQPPAVVGGREISWQVPVHVFTRDPALIEAFTTAGFRPGLTPGPTALGGIEALGPLLLRALDGAPTAAGIRAQGS